MKIENEHTFREALSQGINLFVGAGFSVLAQDSDGLALPLGRALGAELAGRFSIPDGDQLGLAQLCTILQRSRRDDFYSYLRQRFSVRQFDDKYRSLENINVKTYFTTNIDDLLFQIYANSSEHYLNDLDVKGPAFNDRDAIDIVTLHGCVLDASRPLTFSALDIAAAFRTDPDRWHFLTQRIQAAPTLFWGYGVEDSGTLEALNPHSVGGRPHEGKWIILTEDRGEATAEYYKALGFQIITGDTISMLELFYQVAPAKPARVQVDGASTQDLFPQEALPEIGTVPVRPIIEFYLGAPPSWNDIFSARLHRTAHFAKVQDSLHSRKHTIIIGLPACGKTTLTMQVAQALSFAGHKLFCELPSLEKAKQIVAKLSGQQALIFVDNFTDSIEAFDLLMREPNVLLAGTDRDYNFDIVSHRIDRNQCELFDVTELDAPDIQDILSKIPENIRIPFTKLPPVAEGMVPSLFELIDANIRGPTLRDRFRTVLQQLASRDQNLLELLLVCCYVHQCRTPVSMDMLIAYFRDRLDDYKAIYALCNTLGNLVSEYAGEFADTEQDHFVPRSAIVAEAAVDQADRNSLRKMLERFHSEVSPYRIPRYDIFKRSAYDAGLMARAFSEWRDGMQFYEATYARDPSPYLRQQGALYLAQRRRFREAFDWIDEAVMLSGARNPAIRNSHAIILFKANINLDSSDATVRRTLRQSMEILSDCHQYDKRKIYHATVFANQALQYWDVYGDSVARGYLETAQQWLQEERDRSPWNRGVKWLLKDISRKLGASESPTPQLQDRS